MNGSPTRPAYGREAGIPDPVDVHVGKRIRIRRSLLGISQQTLADEVGLASQQVQKYEAGANRVSASRLSAVANVLDVSVSYFFSDMQPASTPDEHEARERMERFETIELIRYYCAIPDERVRNRFHDLVKAIARVAQGVGEPGPKKAIERAPLPREPRGRRRARR
jgi:transcriptional regulator with XRE-family HTH domain